MPFPPNRLALIYSIRVPYRCFWGSASWFMAGALYSVNSRPDSQGIISCRFFAVIIGPSFVHFLDKLVYSRMSRSVLEVEGTIMRGFSVGAYRLSSFRRMKRSWKWVHMFPDIVYRSAVEQLLFLPSFWYTAVIRLPVMNHMFFQILPLPKGCLRFQNVRFQNVRFQNVWNVRFTKRQVYITSGLQNVRFTKRQVFKTSGCKKTSIYICCACGWWKSAGSVAAMFAGKVRAVFYSLF